MAALASWQRQEVLEHCVREFQARFEELALSLCVEAGKPIKVGKRSATRPSFIWELCCKTTGKESRCLAHSSACMFCCRTHLKVMELHVCQGGGPLRGVLCLCKEVGIVMAIDRWYGLHTCTSKKWRASIYGICLI
jgi:hypothetical protein